MSQVLNNLLSLLKLETIEQGIYRGQSQDLGLKAVFWRTSHGTGPVGCPGNHRRRASCPFVSLLLFAPR